MPSARNILPKRTSSRGAAQGVAPAGVAAGTRHDRRTRSGAGRHRVSRDGERLRVLGAEPGALGYPGTAAITGTRKPRGAELTDVQRACNTAINSTRAAVERAIAHLVNWKILDTGWRGRLADFPEVLRTVTGLEIYRTWG
jgi:DDE superfamily endonuclease